MKQFVISRCRQTWGTEYSVEYHTTKEAVLHAIHKDGWKSKIDAYDADSALLFSMKCRDLFGLTYDIIDAEGSAMGLLDRENWLSPVLQVVDARSRQTAQVVKVSPSLYEEFHLDLNGQAICLFRRADAYSTPLICGCLNESRFSLRLMLSVGILMLGQGTAEVAGVAA